MLAMAAASMIWGLSPLFYKPLEHVPPGEIMSHRVVWAFVIFASVLAVQGRFRLVFASLTGSLKTFGLAAVSALMIALNWFFLIYAVLTERTTDASLGYFIFPLVAVLIGAAVFREQLTPTQKAAVAIAAAGVLVLTIGLGTAPWISIILAISFAVYGYLKKNTSESPIGSVANEALIIAPFALGWLIGVHFFDLAGIGGQTGGYFGARMFETFMFVSYGVITASPLILMAYASQRILYSEVGLIQYVNPTLQFLVAILVFGEPFTVWHGMAFPAIWVALLLFSASTLGYARFSRKPSINADTESRTTK